MMVMALGVQVVEMEGSSLLDTVGDEGGVEDVAGVGLPDQPGDAGVMLEGDLGAGTAPTPEGFELSAEQLMNLTTGDLLEINGEMYKVSILFAISNLKCL